MFCGPSPHRVADAIRELTCDGFEEAPAAHTQELEDFLYEVATSIKSGNGQDCIRPINELIEELRRAP